MSELLTTKSRDVLGECTEEWRKNPVDPLEAVTIFHKKMGSLANKYSTYLSTSVSSGGWVRDKSLSSSEAIVANGRTALQYADRLHELGLIDLHSSVDAVSIGHIPGWEQYGYLKFWLPVMGRIDFTTVNIRQIQTKMTKFEKQHDMDLFNDSTASQDSRRPLHHAFERAFASATATMDKHPIGRVVQLIDPDLSLGGDVEKKYASDEAIDLKRPAYHGSMQDFLASITQDDLATQLTRLDQLGARFLEDGTEPRLTLRTLAECAISNSDK